MRKFLPLVLALVIMAPLSLVSSAVNAAEIPTNVVYDTQVSDVSCVSATLSASLQQWFWKQWSRCQCVEVYFEYGTSPGSYPNQTAHQTICNPKLDFSSNISLIPCVTYYARAVVICDLGPAKGPAGIGLDPVKVPLFAREGYPFVFYGSEITFNTIQCCTSKTSSGGGSGGWELTSTRPYLPPMFDIPAAKVSATKAAPGEQVEVTATITNKGGSNGTTKVILYVNGQEADSKGIALASGQSTPVSFKVSRNDPGTYQVHVNSVPAGSFTVDLFNSNDMLIYASVALFAIGLIGLLYYLMKRRTTA